MLTQSVDNRCKLQILHAVTQRDLPSNFSNVNAHFFDLSITKSPWQKDLSVEFAYPFFGSKLVRCQQEFIIALTKNENIIKNLLFKNIKNLLSNRSNINIVTGLKCTL